MDFPGTTIPEPLQRSLQVRAVEDVVFTEQSLESFTHRDAVRFDNGREVLLQFLQPGQRVDVVSLTPAVDRVSRVRETDDQLALVG